MRRDTETRRHGDGERRSAGAEEQRRGGEEERARWRKLAICYASITVIAIAEGAYLVIIVSYLERSRVPVNQIGTIMAFLSILEAITTLGAGLVLRRWSLLATLALPLLVQATSAALLVFQPLGPLVWASAALNGLGMGLVGVALFATALEGRPSRMRLGTTVGWYTGFIAVGNGLGAVLSGLLADRWGFPSAFAMSATAFVVAAILAVVLHTLPRLAPLEAEAPIAGQADRNPTVPAWAWMAAVVTAFSLASVNGVFETLFPVYGLRAGLSISLVGGLEGLKMMLAGIIRPFAGLVLHRVTLMPVNTGGLIAIGVASCLLPFAGLAAGLALIMVALGLSFGATRVVSATLLLTDGPPPEPSGRRISYYNTALCVGAIVGPWLAGTLAARLNVSLAFVLAPVLLVGLFLLGLAALPRLAAAREESRQPVFPA